MEEGVDGASELFTLEGGGESVVCAARNCHSPWSSASSAAAPRRRSGAGDAPGLSDACSCTCGSAVAAASCSGSLCFAIARAASSGFSKVPRLIFLFWSGQNMTACQRASPDSLGRPLTLT